MDLSHLKIKEFMSKLPDDKVPQLDTKGARYWLKQRVHQMPLQDFSTKHCRKLALDQKMAMDDMCLKRLEKAVGVGKKSFIISEIKHDVNNHIAEHH